VSVLSENSAALATYWLEVERYLTVDGLSSFPKDAPNRVLTQITFAKWAGQQYTTSIDTGWMQDYFLGSIDGLSSADTQYWIPTDSPKAMVLDGSLATITATWLGHEFQRQLSGIGTNTITDSGWVIQ